MDLYLLRHGLAGDSLVSYADDAKRELTDEGKEKTRAQMKALAKLKMAPPDVIVSSTLVRAQQTAKIAREVFAPDAVMRTSDGLQPHSELERAMALVAELSEEYRGCMLVGHEPHLSTFASVLLSGSPRQIVEMKKSSLALFTIYNFDVPRMRGYLRMLLPPKIGSL